LPSISDPTLAATYPTTNHLPFTIHYLPSIGASVLHIAIDAHSVGTGLAGNESYATNLVEALAEIDTKNQYTLYVTKAAAVQRFQGRWPNVSVRMTLPHTPLIRIPLTLSAELRRNPVDLLHVQFTAPPICPCPVIVSIHDLAFEHLPETFKRRSRFQLRFTVRRTARKAAEIITISEYSKCDIIQTYKINPAKVTVTPLAAPPAFAPVTDPAELDRVARRHGIVGDYVLAVGSIQPRKNLNRLIEAYSGLVAARGAALVPILVVVGKHAWLYRDTLELVEKQGLRDKIIFTGYVPESDLPALYSGALFFVYPSYFEGFGLPPLEAMQCGTPVMVGNRTSLPEVVGDAGLMVDPFDVPSIASGLAQMLDNAEFRTQLRVKGIERARGFNWKRTAELTLEVYQRTFHAQKMT
jgi:glycosyltransferase involved in cell wall biosynthesis